MGMLIRAANLAGVEELMAELGGDGSALLARHHVDPARIRDGDAYIPQEIVVRVLEQGAMETDCPDFGLRLVRWQGLNMLGPVAVITQNADTVLNAFYSLSRYLHVHGPGLRLSLLGRNHAGDYCYDFRMEGLSAERLVQAYELSIANGIHIFKMLAGESARPECVYFTHAPVSPLSVYRKAFACAVEFNAAHCGFDLAAKQMQQKLTQADSYTRQMAMRYLEASFPSGSAVSEQVRDLIHRLLAIGHCSITPIAEALAMHPRTLQRALKQEGTHYEALLDEVRRDKAYQYLTQSNLRFSQIAAMLAYSDQSTFNRACRRWYNCTPKSLRSRAQQSSV